MGTYPREVRPRLAPLLTGEESERRISLRKVVTVAVSTLMARRHTRTSVVRRCRSTSVSSADLPAIEDHVPHRRRQRA